MEISIKGFQWARHIMSQPAIRDLIESPEFPPPTTVEDTQQIAEFICRYSRTLYHPSCTCRMGADATSVVDPQLRVRGVEGLRVVDASVMPRLISGNTNAATIMIAEKAADMIRGVRAAPSDASHAA